MNKVYVIGASGLIGGALYTNLKKKSFIQLELIQRIKKKIQFFLTYQKQIIVCLEKLIMKMSFF